jgi:hypothetical protein
MHAAAAAIPIPVHDEERRRAVKGLGVRHSSTDGVDQRIACHGGLVGVGGTGFVSHSIRCDVRVRQV